MGYPLSTFQQLSRLCNDEPYIRREFDRFRTVAVIVHSPRDDDFRRTVKYAFEHLHEVTGEGFAFITLIDPPSRWGKAHRGWMDTRERLSAGDGLDDENFVLALRRRLDLPDGPCLVLTGDLLSDRYAILPTSAEKVVAHMEAISQFVGSRTGRIPADDPDFQSFLSYLGPAFSESVPGGESLAKVIADLTAVKALMGNGSARSLMAMEDQRREAQRYVMEVLLSLWNKLNELEEDQDPDSSSPALDAFTDYLAQVIREVRGADRRQEPFRPHDQYVIGGNQLLGLEPRAITYVENYNLLLPVYFDGEEFGSGYVFDVRRLLPEGIDYDYSPLGNLLGKTVEEEMNASLVQRARQLMGVHMPEFYRRFEDALGVNYGIKTKKKTIFLNDKGARRSVSDYYDRTLPMGEILCVLRQLSQDRMKADRMGWSCTDSYIDEADAFARLRNKACHMGVFNRNAFDDMHRSFLMLAVDYFPRMQKMKEALLGGGDLFMTESLTLWD